MHDDKYRVPALACAYWEAIRCMYSLVAFLMHEDKYRVPAWACACGEVRSAASSAVKEVRLPGSGWKLKNGFVVLYWMSL